MDTREHILAHCGRYPQLQPPDLLKFLHHSVFGCGHLVASPEAAEDWLRREMEGCTDSTIEPLDGAFCRVHLGLLTKLGISPRSFARLFALSAQKEAGTAEELESRLTAALELAREGRLPFSFETLSTAVEAWRAAGFPAQHHSEMFRRTYAPAYRVLHRAHAELLPLLGRIDTLLRQNEQVIFAIDGGAGSGKSTVAHLLQQVYDCTVLHMDDFFLRPEQRTPERYATPGGNVDHERFLEEVLLPLRQGKAFRYRPFDCGTFTVSEGFDVTPRKLTVVEGSYSLHPTLRQYYDGSAFLRIDPAVQRARIEKRNSPAFAQRFFDTWIPLEQAYFDTFAPAEVCDLILEANV